MRDGTASKNKSGQALHGTGRTSLPLLPSGPGGVHAPAHAWHLADADHARSAALRNTYCCFSVDAVAVDDVEPELVSVETAGAEEAGATEPELAAGFGAG